MASRQLIRLAWIGIAAVGLAAEVASAQTPIAHWSFDTATVTTGANGITAATDATATHNATTQYGGTGGTGGGAPQINSVAGQFGEAAEFTNANQNGTAQTNHAWMSFPQLTEIAGPSGGDFSVAVWANVPPEVATWDDQPILVDWGNAAAGTHRFTYWFQLDNVDSNLALRPRAQIRNANAPPDPATIDIIATTLSAAQAGSGTPAGATTFDDNAWHHLAWTWTKSTGEMRYYTDGVLRHTQTSTQPLANRDLLVSDSAVGAIGAKRDNNRYIRGAIDEMWVFNGVLSGTQLGDLYQTNTPPGPVVPTVLSIQVNTVTGAVNLQNTTASPIALSSYRITSASDSLDPSSWDPISTGTPVAGFPQGDGTGNGWEVAPNPSGHELVEWYLTGDSTLANGGSISLGSAFHETVAQLVGDYNSNGTVDAADYVAWQENEGTMTGLPNDPAGGQIGAAQYDNWVANFGRRSGTQDLVFQYTLADGTVKTGSVSYVTSAVGSAVVPEPATAGLLLIGAFVGIVPRRKI